MEYLVTGCLFSDIFNYKNTEIKPVNRKKTN